MKIVDRGGGTPVVVIPGAQGRWEWMKPAIDALAQRCRVITFSLADEPSAAAPFDPQRGFWCYVDQVRDALDAAGVDRAAICGVSYGGFDCRSIRRPLSRPRLVAGARFGAAPLLDARPTCAVLLEGTATSGAVVRHFVAAAVHRDRSRQPRRCKWGPGRSSSRLPRRWSHVVAAENGTSGSVSCLGGPSEGGCRCDIADACCDR